MLRTLLFATVGLMTLMPVGYGQPRRGGFGGGLPQVGSQLPEVEVFDERGQVVSTASLKGSYTVLVFGCLT